MVRGLAFGRTAFVRPSSVALFALSPPPETLRYPFARRILRTDLRIWRQCITGPSERQAEEKRKKGEKADVPAVQRNRGGKAPRP
ncbi:MAG: hypothetical protein HSCHL_0056 [Hydrogenibacillus schlegelii]|uniref:Uncharacterized protein n=1 Tax=Hydrogenibacillus schlegelii TaxID=1484 RepID=A0A2T5GE61_HYDSH|nr:MAG: hypothetical protein HSCHL_0056 [Hydrogenibacillus schlegelii]